MIPPKNKHWEHGFFFNSSKFWDDIFMPIETCIAMINKMDLEDGSNIAEPVF